MIIPDQTTVSVREAAKVVRFPGGEKKFMAWLRSKKYLMPNNEPYQRYVKYGWFVQATKQISKAKPAFTVLVPRITLRGLEKLETIVYNEFYKCKCP